MPVVLILKENITVIAVIITVTVAISITIDTTIVGF